MTHPQFDKTVALRLRDAVLADRELPHGAKVIWWLIHTRLVSTAEGIQTGAVTITKRMFLDTMRADHHSIAAWTRLLRTRGFLEVKESPARHGEFPCNVFFLPPGVPKPPRTGVEKPPPSVVPKPPPSVVPKPPRTGVEKPPPSVVPKPPRTGVEKPPLKRDKKRQEEGGERERAEAPPFEAKKKAIKGAGFAPAEAGPEKAPAKTAVNGVPKFAPIPPDTFHSTLEKMLKRAELDKAAAKARPDLQVRELRKDVADLIADYVENQRPRAAERAAQLKADPRNWKATDYTDHGKAVLAAWMGRITEIENAMKGIVSHE